MTQTAYLTLSDFVTAGITEVRLFSYAPGETHEGHPRLDAAILAASGEVDEYLLRRGVPVPLTMPVEHTYRENLIDLALDYLTRRADRRPQSIIDNAKTAREFFEKVATGRIDVDNPNAGPGQSSIVAQNPFAQGRLPSQFDSSDPSSTINSILPPLGGPFDSGRSGSGSY